MKTKNLIIGGGFAGLYLASRLGEAILVEEESDVGGLLRGFKSSSGDFTFDIGGHVYTTKDENLSELLSKCNPSFFDERLAFYDYELRVPYPIQYSYDMLGIPLDPHPKERYESLSALLIHEFGNRFYEKVLGPFNYRVWSTSPSSMSADWITGRIALLKDISLKWGSNSSFCYATGNDILNTLQNSLEEVKIFTRTRITSINYDEKIAYVKCESPAVYSGPIIYENLYDTSGFVLDDFGMRLPHNNVLTIGIGLNKIIDTHFHWWYNSVENDSPIHRITLLSRYHEGLAPYGTDSLLIEIPYKPLPNDITASKFQQDYFSKGEIMKMLREAKFKFIEEKDIAETMAIHSKGYPIPTIPHRITVATARREFKKKKVYLVGRWGAHGYYNLDHLIKDVEYTIMASLGIELENYFWANYYYKEQRRF